MPDLSSLDTKRFATEGRVLKLRHPVTNDVLMTDEAEPQPMTITLHGTDSDQFAKHKHAMSARLLEEQGRLPDAEEAAARNAELFVAVTSDWHLWLEGQLVPFSKEMAKIIYIRFPWIRDQIDNFVSARKNFIQG